MTDYSKRKGKNATIEVPVPDRGYGSPPTRTVEIFEPSGDRYSFSDLVKMALHGKTLTLVDYGGHDILYKAIVPYLTAYTSQQILNLKVDNVYHMYDPEEREAVFDKFPFLRGSKGIELIFVITLMGNEKPLLLSVLDSPGILLSQP